jgi:hypothetical protein
VYVETYYKFLSGCLATVKDQSYPPMTATHQRPAAMKRNTSDDDGVLTLEVPEAGAMVGLSRNASYEAAARGEIPTLRFGRLLKVPRAAWLRKLEQPDAVAAQSATNVTTIKRGKSTENHKG